MLVGLSRGICDGRRAGSPAWDCRLTARSLLATIARTVGVVRARLNRIRLGNFGDCKSVGGGVEELRIDFGPGYRVYFGRDGAAVVVLVGGGSKRTQTREIRTAQQCWKEYLDAKTDG